MTLPTFQGSLSRMYPFASKSGSKKGAIQNVNFQYNIRGENRIQTTDSLFFKKEMFDDAKAGFQHTIPLTTNFKLFKYFSASANTSYNEVWTFNTIDRRFDRTTNETITTDKTGFDSFRTYNFSTSIGTTIYGMFNFEKEGQDKKIKAIRHIVRPSVSYNINPAFDQYYDTYEAEEIVSADGTTTRDIEEYTRFEGGIFGTPWSPVRMSGSTQLFQNKMNINFNATLDPYALDNNNTRINKFNIDNGGSLFRLTAASLNTSWSLASKKSDKKKNKKDKGVQENVRSGGRADDLFGVSEDFSNQQNRDEAEEETPSDLYNYSVPWNLRIAYAINYSNNRRQSEIASHSLMFSGDIELSPKWSIGASSGYDLKNLGFTFTQLRFERDLLSWRMNFSWVPFSNRSSWNFFIGIKSSILQDLKYEQRRQPDIQF